MVELKNFTKKYKDFTAARDISFSCGKGKILGLLGPNGAGKTTVLKALSARHLPSAGSVLVEGRDTAEETEKVRNLTGFAAEETLFPDEYRVTEYLESVMLIHSGKTIKDFNRENNGYIKDLFNKLSIEELFQKKIKKLSKGQKQRVNFAQALLYNPPVLIFDEPATGLDPSQIIKMRKFIFSLKENHTVIISTHIMQEAENLCDEVLIISNGKKAAFGTIPDILKDTESKSLEEAFFKLTQVEVNNE